MIVLSCTWWLKTKYSCLIKRNMHNKGEIFKIEIFLYHQ